MLLDIRGQLNSMSLPPSKALWPLFETVVNAIQSIEDSENRANGIINIFVERETPTQLMIDEEEPLGRIVSFSVTDNGIGFTTDNYNSFNTAYSSYKIAKGCKGIGRFLWLLAFDHAEIDSVYREDGNIFRRIFVFSDKGPTPEDNIVPESDKSNIVTTIRLCEYKAVFQENCPLGLEVLAKKIVEHCLPFFISGNCPRITIQDGISPPVELNSYFHSIIEPTLHQDKFELNNEVFTIYHMQLAEGADKHELHLCANMQEVKDVTLSPHIPNLRTKIPFLDKAGSFYYVGYVSSSYLDDHVSSTRTSFEFEQENGQMSLMGTGEEEIVNAALEFIKGYLADYLEDISKRKKRQVDDFVQQSEPQYKYMLAKRPEIYDRLPANLPPDALDLALHKELQDWEREIKISGQKLEKARSDQTAEAESTYHELFEEYWQGVTELSKTCLAEYVARRKAILKLLEDTLTIQDNGRFKKEEAVHSIICPMRHTSDEVSFEEMNLWIVDERLAYHKFLASDKTIKSLPGIDGKSRKEVDIAIFDQAFAFSEDDGLLNTITIIEFKKPDNKQDNPINQMGGYIDEIVSGQKVRASGLAFGDCSKTSFRCFAICDMTPKMQLHCKNAGFQQTPDGMGYYGYQSARNAYYEVISYSKLLADARKRNQILFDKLFSPKINEIIHIPEVEQKGE